ncbi:MAG: hypothetical protein ACRENE_04890 [Polyangiaceae bacterium]
MRYAPRLIRAGLRVVLAVLAVLSEGACGSSEQTKESTAASGSPGAFQPPALPNGYLRLTANPIRVPAGSDVTHCQYVMAPLDRDVDIVDVTGSQSTFGHHDVAFSYAPQPGDEVGSEVKCMMGNNEFTSGVSSTSSGVSAQALGGSFLGGAGPKGATTKLPAGVAFRLPKGQGVVLNLHYINPSGAAVTGYAYMDLKLAEVDPNRLIAALFVNINGSFTLPPSAPTDSSMDCVAQSDVNLIMVANHMHEYGTHATSSVVRKDTGAIEVLRVDPVWTADMVNNPTYARWDVASPFVLHAGDTIRTSCSWENTSAAAIMFPREMCITAAFALATGANPKAPACYNGSWIASL